MPTPALQRLRKSHLFVDLPATIDTGRAGDDAAKPIEMASVDDVAFAMQSLADQTNAVYGTISSLRVLHDRARRAGALGSARAVDVVAQNLDVAR